MNNNKVIEIKNPALNNFDCNSRKAGVRLNVNGAQSKGITNIC